MSDTPVKKKTKQKKKKKADPFWPIVIILSILAFTGSFWLFYSVTKNINTKSFPTTDTPKWTTPTPEPITNGTIMIGDGNLATPTPTPLAPTPSPIAASASSTPTPEPTPTPTPAPTATATPLAVPTEKPKVPTQSSSVPTPESSQEAVKQIAYRVQAGSFQSKDQAQETLTKLSEQGYKPQLVEEADKYIIQLGTFEEQEKALALAEEVIQRRFNVSVRRIER